MTLADCVFWCSWFATISMRVLWRARIVTAWASRNADRVYTISMFFMAVDRFREGRYLTATFWVVAVLLSLLLWNKPPDDDDRHRRKKEAPSKEERLGDAWSGAELVRT